MLVYLRGSIELMLILLSDHCKSNLLFHQENQVDFLLNKHHVSKT